jgi:ElaB/YqjD/DUF883 family membrane-anchored ribosome-binding protein
MTEHTSPHAELRLTRQRADAARERFGAALQNVRDRIAPARIKDDAVAAVHDRAENAKRGAKGVVRRHPFITGIAMISGIALLFWRPARFLALYSVRGAWFIWLNRAIWGNNDK